MQAQISKAIPYQKLALVIGNDDYQTEQNKLNRSVADAKAVAGKLNQIGFQITEKHNVENEIMKIVGEFSEKIKEGDLIIFYYSGHICQVEDENILLPTADSKIKKLTDAQDLGASLISARKRLKKFESNIVIMILDGYTGYRIEGEAKGSGHSGLASIPIEDRTAVIYATKDKHSVTQITDETGPNNIFTKYFLKYLAEEKLSVLSMFKKIQKDVIQRTQKRQSPMIISRPEPDVDDYNRWIRDLKFELEALTLKGPHNGGVYDKDIRSLIDYMRGKVHEFTVKRNNLIMELYSMTPRS